MKKNKMFAAKYKATMGYLLAVVAYIIFFSEPSLKTVKWLFVFLFFAAILVLEQKFNLRQKLQHKINELKDSQ